MTQTHPPVGSIVQITKDGGEVKCWHGFNVDEYVVRIPHTTPGPNALYARPNGFTQWLSSDSFIVVDAWEKKVLSTEACLANLQSFLDGTTIPHQSAIPRLLNTSPTTQKARGVRALAELGFLTRQIWLVNRKWTREILLPEQLQKGFFARPCPSKPRHGFVNSRVIKTVDELEALHAETLQHDSRGEILCMPLIKAAYSAVLTDHGITMGPGTDGATSGTDTYTIPCRSNLVNAMGLKRNLSIRNGRTKITQVFAKRYITLQPHHELFVETVGETPVQLRTGPKLTGQQFSQTRWSSESAIYCSAVFEVTGHEPFQQFEEDLVKNKKIFGKNCIVYCRTASLMSHYMVQAIAAGMTVMVGSEEPKVGSAYYFQHELDPLEISFDYRKAVLHGLAHGSKAYCKSSEIEWACAVIQGVGSCHYNLHSIRLLMAASMILMRAGTSVCLGEYRHFFDKGPGLHKLPPLGPVGLPLKYSDTRLDVFNRTQIYEAVFSEPWPRMSVYYKYREYLQNVTHDFRHKPWRSAFGGPKWANCTDAVLALYDTMLPFMRTTSKYPLSASTSPYPQYAQDCMGRVVAAANRLITVSHNSGKCLTKLATSSTLNDISNGSTGLMIAKSPLTWKVLTTSCLPKRSSKAKLVTPKANTSSPSEA